MKLFVKKDSRDEQFNELLYCKFGLSKCVIGVIRYVVQVSIVMNLFVGTLRIE